MVFGRVTKIYPLQRCVKRPGECKSVFSPPTLTLVMLFISFDISSCPVHNDLHVVWSLIVHVLLQPAVSHSFSSRQSLPQGPDTGIGESL